MTTPAVWRAHIAGVGETRYARWGGITDTSEHQLACAAIHAAVDDAGFALDEVDGLGSFAGDPNEAAFLAADLGLTELRYADMSWLPGGGGACAAVANAGLAIEAGCASVIVVYRALCQGQFHRFGRAPAAGAHRTAAGEREDGLRHAQGERGFRPAASLLEAQMAFTLPFGMFNAPIAYALVMRRHMHRYGTTSEQMGAVAVACRAHAQHNPRAVMHGRPMTLGDHQRSRSVADPFRLYDCCLESDGACAVVVTTAERARDGRKRPVRVLAHSQGAAAQYGYGPFVNASMPDALYASSGAADVARRLWESATIDPRDVDVAQIYDHFSGLVLLTLEDFGSCHRGEGGRLAESGALAWPHDHLPTNTHGGSLSEAYIHGLNQVVEGVRQLRDESTCQVRDCEICLVTSAAGVPTSALLLGPTCPQCRAFEHEWRELTGRGIVYSYTVVHQAFLPSLREYMPYIVAVLELDGAAGVRFFSNLVDVEPQAVRVGMPVGMVWDDIAPGLAVPRFRTRNAPQRDTEDHGG